ncbi:LysR family transcriptional regulator [Rhizobium miluonense]|uniref:HTH-type transcriptional regulator TtuA n=1 Tax=Rhizobium miluonense TaxID=411945 RepID=A0A1C3WB56_9HYPH|nr:LysR family transcriptional regulator [Rhizobium miluonense]SCB37387.1 DNA-binding transcriptional regulator, LysR family [Rhizobium miluonense]
MDMLSAMRIFTRVVERGSLSAAARDLGLGQPTVSERVEKLEKHLGARLLYRTTRSVQATDAGARFYEYAKRAIEAAEEAEASVASAETSLTGTFRIAAPHGLGEMTLPRLLIEFQTLHPALAVDVTLNDRFVDPMTEGVDLSIRIGEIGSGNFIARRLGTMRRLLLAAPGYIERQGLPREPAELAAHPFIRFTGFAADERLHLIDLDGGPIEVPIRTAWRVNHWRPLMEAVLAERGIGALFAAVCGREIADGRLVPVLPSYEFRRVDVHAIYPPGPRPAARTKAFLALLAERTDLLFGETSGASRAS